MSKRKNPSSTDDLSAFLPSFGKKAKSDGLDANELGFDGFGKQAQDEDLDKLFDKTKKKKVEIKEKSKYQGPEAPDKFYVYGVDKIPENDLAREEMNYETDSDVDVEENPYSLPYSHEVELKGHEGHVSALSLDPSGSRLISGGYDSIIKFWDFNAMDSSMKSFRSIAPETDVITSLQYSPTGDRFIMGSNSPQARVFNRDGKQLVLLPKGYPYIADMAATSGHIAKVTSAFFHPTQPQTVFTSSNDCSIRLWDLNSFKKHKEIIKLRNSQGAVRSGVSTCNIDSTGTTIGCVCVDGSLQFFPSKGPYTRAILRFDSAHQFGSETSSLIFSSDGNTVVTRGGDDTMKIWDKRKLTTGPLVTFDGLPNKYQETDVVLSPDESVVCTGTSLSPDSAVGKLFFYDMKSLTFIQEVSITDNSVISLLWHPKLNQIMCGCTDHKVHVLYNPELSTKGVLYCVTKHPKRDKYEDFVGVQNIQTPHALSMFKKTPSTRRAKEKAKSDPLKAAIPLAPQIGPGAGGRLGSSLTASIMSGLVQKRQFDNDPRASLLKYHDEKGLKELEIYKKTQPVPIFQKPLQEGETSDKDALGRY
jgi:WD40 repeat protein